MTILRLGKRSNRLIDRWSRRKERLYHIRKGFLSKQAYQFKPFNTKSSTLLWARKAGTKRALWGLMRVDGSWQIKPSFFHVDRISSHRVAVQKPGKLHGALDETGKLVISFKKRPFSIWQNGMAAIYKHPQRGLLDMDGELIGGRYFEDAKVPKKGSTIGRVKISGKWQGITPKGKLVDDPLEGSVLEHCPSGIKLLYRSGKRQIMDAQNKQIVPFILERRTFLNCNGLTKIHYKSGWSFFGSNKKWNFIDRAGKLLLAKPLYDNVGKSENNLYPVQKGSLWGLMNEEGAVVLGFKYDSLEWRGKFHLKSTKNGVTTWFDPKGHPYKNIVEKNEGEVFCSNTTKLIKRNGLWGITNPRGKILVKPIYQALYCFERGVAMATIAAKKLWCPIEPDGTMRNIGCQTKFYPAAVESVFTVAKQLDKDPYKSSVLWGRAMLDYRAKLRKTPPKIVSKKIKLPKNTLIIKAIKK